ncbi:MAG: DUF2142 domain-containing protein [Nitrospirae bacterium]|nr:DUF2142 domain-containing protein [Nitrospirota bacterium]
MQYPERVFVFLASGFGVLFILLIPPFQSPDEYAHFYRSYQISEGQLIAERKANSIGGYLPESLLTTILGVTKDIPMRPLAFPSSLSSTFIELGVSIDIPSHRSKRLTLSDFTSLIKLSINSQKRIFFTFQNTASYSPIPYLPQSIGFMFGRIFNFSPILLFYTARVFNLFVWICLVYFSLKIIPFSKWVFLLLALTPMSIFLSSTLSADTFTNGMSFLIISLFIRFAYDKNKEIKIDDILVLIILSGLLFLSKQGYIFLLFLFFLIPVDKMAVIKNWKYSSLNYLIVFFILALTNSLLLTLWSFLVRDTVSLPLVYFPNTSVHDQLKFIISYPLIYCRTIFDTFLIHKFYIGGMIGLLGWQDTPMPKSILYSYFIVILATSFIERDKQYVIPRINKFLIFSIMMLSYLMIATLAYLVWSPLRFKLIVGIQGRYFIPIFPLLTLLFYNTKVSNQRLRVKSFVLEKHLLIIDYLRNNKNKMNLSIIVYVLFSLLCTLIVIVRRYWL